MNIAAFLAGVWMAILGLFGHQPPALQPVQQQGGSTAQTQAVSDAPSSETSATNTGVQAEPSQRPTAPSQSPAAPVTTPSSTAGATLPSGSAWETSVPLGDSKYTTSGPKQGYIYVCHVAQGGGGAQGNPTWINGNVWYPAQKVSVQGSVTWPNASYSMTISGANRTIKSNGLPTDHDTGTFPIQSSDPAYQFDRNPNSIKAQSYDFTLPVSPTTLATPDCIYGQVGIMTDGVPLFDGFDAEYRDAVAHETQDGWEGHPDETGVYHNHGFESGPVKAAVSTVVGYAFDGYPITGSLLPDGNYLHTSDLDECHGLTSTVTLDGKSVTTYHYVLTQDFPYSVSCFHGRSYEPKPGGQSGSQNQQPGQQGSQMQSGSQSLPPSPPQAAVSACASGRSGSSCSFSTQNGSISGTCQTPPGQSSLACVPSQR